MKKTLTMIAFALALSAAVFGIISSSPKNAMAKPPDAGISSQL